jgi:hypothetical protein
MWVRDVERDLAVVIGLIKPGQSVKPKSLADVFTFRKN